MLRRNSSLFRNGGVSRLHQLRIHKPATNCQVGSACLITRNATTSVPKDIFHQKLNSRCTPTTRNEIDQYLDRLEARPVADFDDRFASRLGQSSSDPSSLPRRSMDRQSMIRQLDLFLKDSNRPNKDDKIEKEPSNENDENKKQEKDHEDEKERENNKPTRQQKKESNAKSSTRSPSESSLKGKGDGDSGSKGGGDKLPKQAIPDVYPNALALPITRRPLFPGFYKAVVIQDPAVIEAIKELLERGEPFLGAFLFKDEKADGDTIQSLDQVHPVGVFAQITSIFSHQIGQKPALTAVLYPHRRIKITELFPPSSTTTSSEGEPVAEHVTEEGQGDVQVEGPTAFLKDYAVSRANIVNLDIPPVEKSAPQVRAVASEIITVFKDISSLNPLFKDQIANFSMSVTSQHSAFDDPAKLADFAAAVCTGEVNELQAVLETLDVGERLQKSLVIVKKELLNAQLQSKISKDVENKIQKRQREYFLMEQLRGIKRELGLESDGKEKLVTQFKEAADKLAMPEAVRKTFDEEINKLAHLEPSSSEYNVTRNYLDWLTQVPWGISSIENYNIKHAMTVLDEDHYGLKDVKDRILEFIAVGKLRGKVEGKILCFVGPPGVGKTSIGRSIARALNRKYYRFSVGGLSDVAEIKGHRRTYVGALPGRIVQALKKCQTENPLILIDEVDKIGHGHHGDPSSALLELLDPEQNSSFLDHYLDVSLDLSKVLFVCTANITDTIPRPLLDRMELIEISGYVANEKIAIAERYLSKQAKEAAGLEHADVVLTTDAVESLMKHYCRESGVRNLKKQIEKIYRKASLNIVKEYGNDAQEEAESKATESEKVTSEEQASVHETEKKFTEKNSPESESPEHVRPEAMKVPSDVHVVINGENLKDYVGPPVYTADRLYDKTPPGVVMGLAWTSMGGAALYVESVLEQPLDHNSRAGLERTGQLGDVMKESSSIAYSFARMFLTQEFPNNRFFERAKIHLHCPEGAVPKDGPSAGITMASSLLSLALRESLDPTVAMTGELTLTGKVLRIGGLREKTVAAKRSGATTVIFPAGNKADWAELPDNVKEGINGIPVDWYSDVFKVLFPNADKEAESIWKREFDLIESREKEHKNERVV